MQLQHLLSRHHSGKTTTPPSPHIFLKRAMQTVRVAVRSHLSHASLRDRSSILSTVTQSVPRPICRLLPLCLTYVTAAGESAISFAPSRLYGGKSGGRGFRGPFPSYSSSFV